MVLPAVGGHAEPTTTRLSHPRPSHSAPGIPPPPTRVSNAPHRGWRGGAGAAGGEGGREGRTGHGRFLPAEFPGKTPAEAARLAVGRGAARRSASRSAPCATPRVELRPPRAALPSPQRRACKGSWPKRCQSRERQATKQSSSFFFFYLFIFFLKKFLPFPPALRTVQLMTLL